MSTAIHVPALGESINEAIVARWLKQVGDSVIVDEPIVELETDKITVEVPAPIAGVLIEHQAAEGDRVQVGDVVARVDHADVAATKVLSDSPGSADSGANASKVQSDTRGTNRVVSAMPAAEAEAGRLGVNLAELSVGSGRGGRLLKEDVKAAAQLQSTTQATAPLSSIPARNLDLESSSSSGGSVLRRPVHSPAPVAEGQIRERRVAMTALRKRIAERLVASQQNAAILTTFNEVDMSAVMEVRKRYKDQFLDRHGVKLGFMSFFVKAATEALQSIPAVNAEIQGEEIIYKEYYDIGVAVGGGRGLVVPVIREANQLGFAAIEREIGRLAGLAKTNKLQISDLTGGTFTISNGGIYGSMLSTPILNPPQTGILGLHNIVERPVAVAGKVEIRPIMYLALSYDHRLVDGREAVQFLVQIKACIEDPYRMMLEV